MKVHKNLLLDGLDKTQRANTSRFPLWEVLIWMTWHMKWSQTVETSHWTPNTYKHILNIYFHLKKEGTLSSSLVLFLISPHKEHLTLHLVQQLLCNRNVTSVNGDVNGLALNFIQRALFNYSHPFTLALFSIVKCFLSNSQNRWRATCVKEIAQGNLACRQEQPGIEPPSD